MRLRDPVWARRLIRCGTREGSPDRGFHQLAPAGVSSRLHAVSKSMPKPSRNRGSARRRTVSPSKRAPRSRGSGPMQAPPIEYRLRIVLRDVSPAVWRRVIVPGALTFEGLHEVIQVVMGWQNYHLYDFELGTRRFGISDPEFADDDFEDAARFRLRDAGLAEGRTFLYRYDFGDGWEHELSVEEILESPQEGPARARCIEGARACPPGRLRWTLRIRRAAGSLGRARSA